MAELVRQLLIAPPEKRTKQVQRAEQLHDEVDPQLNYPFDFLTYRLTGYRSETDNVTLVGEALLPDLRLLIDMLSRSVGMPRSSDEPVQTTHALAEQLDVSTKTIDRWRKLGLRWRWAAPASGGRKQLVFTQSAVDRFLHSHTDRVERAQQFSQLDSSARTQLLDEARQIAADPGMSLFRAARRLARQSGRAVETIRLLLEQHDRRHPRDRIFAHHRGSLSPRQKQVIARAQRMGVSVAKISAHFRRAPATIHRVLRERRAAALQRMRIDYVASPLFDRDDADEVLLRTDTSEPDDIVPEKGLAAAMADLPEPVRQFYRRSCMSPDRLRSQIVKMNFLKHKASRLRDQLSRYTPSVRDMDNVESCLEQATTIRGHLVRANLQQVLLVARQHLSQPGDDVANRLIDLLEVGNRELIQAIDVFDVSKGQPFAQHLTWLLQRRFASLDTETESRARRRLSGDSMVRRLHDAAAKDGVDVSA